MKLVILGSIGLDDVKTPFGKKKGVLGGSAVYASYAASFFVHRPSIGLVSIAGTDFPKEHSNLLKNRGINLDGVQRKGKTFRWQGLYEFDMNEAKTLKTELNSLADLNPILPKDYQNAEYIFLANVDPDCQLKVLSHVKKPKLVIADTMNYWISSKKESLIKLIKKVNILLLNEGEARQLYQTSNLIKAGRLALQMGPELVIIKKGEHGALLFSSHSFFSAPSYPLEELVDPTGAGDSFGAGLIGYLVKTDDLSESNIRKGIIYGSVMASFCTEGFSLDRFKEIDIDQIEERYQIFRKIREF